MNEDDYDCNTNARLIPPPMESYTVPVRFRFTGEEPPRVWTGKEEEME